GSDYGRVRDGPRFCLSRQALDLARFPFREKRITQRFRALIVLEPHEKLTLEGQAFRKRLAKGGADGFDQSEDIGAPWIPFRSGRGGVLKLVPACLTRELALNPAIRLQRKTERLCLCRGD